MLEATQQLPDHVLEAVDAVEAESVPEGAFSSVVVCGMGGSSIGGALAAGHLERRIDVPIHVLRDHEPPAFVDENTLVVATSYSGNTDETLDAAKASLEMGASLVSITTGGELGRIVDEKGLPWIQPPSGYEPRAAVGWLWAANQATLAQAFGTGGLDRLRSTARALGERVDPMAREGGRADRIAQRLGNGPVGVVGHDLFGVVARRWAGELSENAKRLAFHARLPEAAHNQIVGWTGDPAGACLVVLGREDEQGREAVRTRFLAKRARKAGADVEEVRIGATGLEATMEAVLLGDLVSLHLARREGVDPEPVSVIDDLKDRLAGAQ